MATKKVDQSKSENDDLATNNDVSLDSNAGDDNKAKTMPSEKEGENGNEGESSDNGLDIASLGTSHLIGGFDPAIHAVLDDGSPRLKADGTFAMKRGKKPNSAKASVATNTTKKVIASNITPETYTMTAIPIVMCIEQVGLQIGPEWKMADEEKDAQVGTWANYLRSKGITELSPGALLAIVTLGYAIPRLSTDNTQSKLKKFLGNISGMRGRLAKMFGG